MMYDVLDAYDANGATDVLIGHLYRALHRLCEGRPRRRRQEIGDALSSVLAWVLVLHRSMSFAFMLANVSMSRVLYVLCSLVG